MNKVVIKETNRVVLIIDIILYGIIVFLGLLLIEFEGLKDLDILLIAQVLLNTICFFSILAYCSNRRKNDYEFLIFGFINILVSAFLLINDNYSDTGLVLANGMLIYTVCYYLNKLYSSYRLYFERNINFLPKFIISTVLLIAEVFMSIMIYNNSSFSSYILGNYFLLFGLLSLIEPLIIFLFRNPQIETKVRKGLKYDSDKEEKKVKRMREIPKKRPSKMKMTK